MWDWRTLTVGLVLVAVSAVALWRHWVSYRREMEPGAAEEEDRAFQRRRLRRRMQTSGLIGLVGLLIAAGDRWIWNQGPAAATAYWLFVLLIIAWIILLALGDMAATQVYQGSALARLRAKQRALSEEAERLRQQILSDAAGRGNGHGRPPSHGTPRSTD